MTTKLPQFNKADRIRNPYGLARWLADKFKDIQSEDLNDAEASKDGNA